MPLPTNPNTNPTPNPSKGRLKEVTRDLSIEEYRVMGLVRELGYCEGFVAFREGIVRGIVLRVLGVV